MQKSRAQVFWSLLFIALAAISLASCFRQCPCACETTATSPSPKESTAPPAPNKEDVVGMWRGYWSPAKSVVETERYLFLGDGRWGWLATGKDLACLERGVAQRSGRWSIQGDQLVLEELQRKEITGCKDSLSSSGNSAGPISEANRTECRVPTLSATRNANALVESIPIGQCPPNQEAEQQDKSYACLSIGGKAFWRHQPNEKVDESLFLGDK